MRTVPGWTALMPPLGTANRERGVTRVVAQMSLERRGWRLYYYRARRQGGRVVKEYVGAGIVGLMAADEGAKRAAERAAQLAASRVESAQLDAVATALRAALEETIAQASEVLRSLGFHNHKGQWRRRRR